MAEEKRRSVRTDLHYTLTLNIVKSANSRNLTGFEVEVLDVSSGGIGFKTDEQLMIGEIFTGVLQIWTKKKIDVVLKIVRAAVEEEGYSYGSIFVGIPNIDASDIEIYQMFSDKSKK